MCFLVRKHVFTLHRNDLWCRDGAQDSPPGSKALSFCSLSHPFILDPCPYNITELQETCGRVLCEIRPQKVNSGALWTSVFIFRVSTHSILLKMTAAPFSWEAVLSWLSVSTCKRGFEAFTHTDWDVLWACVCLRSRKARKFSPMTAVCLLFLAGALTFFLRHIPNFCQFANPPVILTMWVTACPILALLLWPTSKGLTVLALWEGREAFRRMETLSSVTEISIENSQLHICRLSLLPELSSQESHLSSHTSGIFLHLVGS